MNFDINKVYSGFKAFYKKNSISFSNQHQKNLNFLISRINQDARWKDIRQVAYFLTTVFWETAKTLAPVKEYRAKIGTRARSLQDKYWDSNFMGRGYVQVTHRANYEKLSKVLNVDLLENPDLMLNPTLSYEAAVYGMIKGLFTGKKLDDFINATHHDYVNARKIINSLDKAEQLAIYAKDIEALLRTAIVSQTAVVHVPQEEFEALEQVPPEEAPEHTPTTVEYIEKHTAEKPSGLRSWKTTIISVLSSVGAAATSVFGWLKEKATDPTTSKILLIAAVVLVITGLLALIFYILNRNKLVIEREKMAHELTMKELEIRANPAYTNIEVNKVK